ncbi:MAG: tyrosine-type recombinase/integrase [Terriglobales bacterium]
MRGKRQKVWVGRWLDDEIRPDGTIHRRHRSEVLGTLKDYPTKHLAQRALEAHIAGVNSPNYRPRTTVTFDRFVQQWRANVLPQHKPSTQRAIESHLRYHLLPCFGSFSLMSLDTLRLQQFIATRKASAKTIKNLVATLSMMWRAARCWGFVEHNPFNGLVLPELSPPRTRSFTVQEAVRIIDAANEPHRTFYWLAAETGMRAGELCGLRWEDIDFERWMVRVEQTAWHGMIQTPKSRAGRRVFPISDRLGEHLRRMKGSGHVFTYRNGKPWKGEKVVEYHLRPLLDRLGIARRGLHAFRHTNGTELDRMNAPIKVRQERLGHSDPRITLGIYTDAVSEDHRRVAEQLGAIFCPSLLKTKTSFGAAVPEAQTSQ